MVAGTLAKNQITLVTLNVLDLSVWDGQRAGPKQFMPAF